MKKRATVKRIGSMLMTLALMVAMIAPGVAMPAYAAGYTVSGTYQINGVELPKESTFTLYKVGSFGRDEQDPGKSILVLDPAIIENGFQGDINLKIDRSDYADTDAGTQEWTDAWLEQAKTLADWVSVQSDVSYLSPQTTTTANGKFSFDNVENGLYLLIGGPRQKVGKEGNDSSYYTPAPMFVQVLNGNVDLSIKPVEEHVKDFSVKKLWDDEKKEALRPATIEIDVYYGKEIDRVVEFSEDQTVVTMKRDEKIASVTYTKEGKAVTTYKDGTTSEIDYAFTPYFYPWEAKDIDEEWKVIEVLDDKAAETYGYTTTDETTANVKNFTITNKYDRKKLEITKVTDNLKTAEGTNITVAFKLVGYDKGGDQIYTGNAAAVITESPQKLEVSSIPRNLVRLEVTEVYSGGNYTPDAETKVATFVAAKESDADGAKD